MNTLINAVLAELGRRAVAKYGDRVTNTPTGFTLDGFRIFLYRREAHGKVYLWFGDMQPVAGLPDAFPHEVLLGQLAERLEWEKKARTVFETG